MANRDLNFTPNVTNVTPVNPDGFAPAVANLAAQVADTSEQSKLLANTAAAHVQFKALDAQYREKFAGDPNNPEGQKWLAEQRQNVTDSLGENISSLYMGDWANKTTKLAASSDVSNEAWALHQNHVNTINNVNNSIQTYTDMANKDGQAFGASDGSDGSAIMNFSKASQEISSFGYAHLGQAKTDALLQHFSSDYAKAFVSGVAETSPAKAIQLIQSPDIAQHFSTQDREDMIAQVEKVKKSQALATALTTTKNDSEILDIVNNPDSTYYDKRAQIDKLDMAGAITPSTAAKARRVIKSSSDLDAQTDTPVMSQIVNQIYDLNANSNSNAADYLRGVRDLQGKIIEAQADGTLTAPDAGKMNRQLSQLTNKRMSDATQSVGNDFYEANQSFNILPPEYRGDATRKLFYAGDGKSFTPAQYKAAALTIIDQINGERRAAALRTVAAAHMSDADFLKNIPNASPENITATARQHGITEAEVVQQLRAKYTKAKRGAPIRRVGSDESGDLGPIGGPVNITRTPAVPSEDERAIGDAGDSEAE